MIEAFEKDCPVCGHKTVMKGLGPTAGVYSGTYAYCVEPTRFYCWGCGSTFEEVTTTELVKEGGRTSFRQVTTTELVKEGEGDSH